MGPGAEARSQRDLRASGAGGGGICRAGGHSASSQSKDCGYPGGKDLGGPQPTKDISGPPQQHNQPRAWQDAALGTGEALGTTGGSILGWNRSWQEERKSSEGAERGLHTSETGHQMPSAGNSTRRGFTANPGPNRW